MTGVVRSVTKAVGLTPDVPSPAKPPPPPTPDNSAEQLAAAERDRTLRAATGGRAADILTGGQGVTDEYESVKKRLLGA